MLYMALLAALAAAAANDPPDYLGLCTEDAAFGVRFGQTVTLAETDILPIVGRRFAPFTRREAIAGPGGRVLEVIGYAELPSEQRASALGAAIRAQLTAAGWRVAEDELGVTFTRPPSPGSPEELSIFLDVEYQEVALDCARVDLRRAARSQRPPDPETRPLPPERPALPLTNAAHCDDPARRGALMADPQQFVVPALEYGSYFNRHIGAMVAWWSGQLVRAGRWTEAERGAFEASLIELPEIAAAARAQQRAVSEVMTTMHGAIDDAPVDGPAACRTGVARQDALRRIVEASERTLQAIEVAYQAEAQRRGVTLQ